MALQCLTQLDTNGPPLTQCQDQNGAWSGGAWRFIKPRPLPIGTPAFGFPRRGKYFVRSTKEKSAVAAREAAEELAANLRAGNQLNRVTRERAFATFAKSASSQ